MNVHTLHCHAMRSSVGADTEHSSVGAGLLRLAAGSSLAAGTDRKRRIFFHNRGANSRSPTVCLMLETDTSSYLAHWVFSNNNNNNNNNTVTLKGF